MCLSVIYTYKYVKTRIYLFCIHGHCAFSDKFKSKKLILNVIFRKYRWFLQRIWPNIIYYSNKYYIIIKNNILVLY